MGFVFLFMTIIINLLLRPRLPSRKSGPLVEWGAFNEPSYMLFSLGIFLLYWTLYFAFFYVRPLVFIVLYSEFDGNHRFKFMQRRNWDSHKPLE